MPPKKKPRVEDDGSPVPEPDAAPLSSRTRGAQKAAMKVDSAPQETTDSPTKTAPKPKAKRGTKRPAEEEAHSDSETAAPPPVAVSSEPPAKAVAKPKSSASGSDPLGLEPLFDEAEDWLEIVKPVLEAQPDAPQYIGPGRPKEIVPVRELTFQALKPNPPEGWKVVIFGQSPYPRVESATGIAMFDNTFTEWQSPRFSRVNSIRCIMKAACKWKGCCSKDPTVSEIKDALKAQKIVQPPEWFQAMLTQGVLLLNAGLTSSSAEGASASKHVTFWRPVVKAILHAILKAKSETKTAKNKGVVFAWWGTATNVLQKYVDVLEEEFPDVKIEHVVHCNPAATGDSFASGNHFQEVNDKLKTLGMDEVDWLPAKGWQEKYPKTGRGGNKALAERMGDFISKTMDLHKFYLDRLQGVGDEAMADLTPVVDVAQGPALPFLDAIKPVLSILENFDTTVKKANFVGSKKATDSLSADEAAALYLYTMQSAFYKTLNTVLRDPNRAKVKPYYGFLKLFLEALKKLKPFTSSLWRGVALDLRAQYKQGTTVTWWGVSSCTPKLSVAQSFLGTSGQRILFEIIPKTAVSIRDFSAFTDEDEYILAPGCQLKVTKVETKGTLTEVRLEEQDTPKLVR
eukprot:TRINITY_DN4319_c0_g1_i1.p1 TRINITY_DN4319_c0_g1~~TRINITY_DN4319_c0_g1_i1.p1  ORF type:complete len:627 (+),score=102.66 TRINITY_DN4319_c0_g1_i1:20-1900(+)